MRLQGGSWHAHTRDVYMAAMHYIKIHFKVVEMCAHAYLLNLGLQGQQQKRCKAQQHELVLHRVHSRQEPHLSHRTSHCAVRCIDRSHA